MIILSAPKRRSRGPTPFSRPEDAHPGLWPPARRLPRRHGIRPTGKRFRMDFSVAPFLSQAAPLQNKEARSRNALREIPICPPAWPRASLSHPASGKLPATIPDRQAPAAHRMSRPMPPPSQALSCNGPKPRPYDWRALCSSSGLTPRVSAMRWIISASERSSRLSEQAIFTRSPSSAKRRSGAISASMLAACMVVVS